MFYPYTKPQRLRINKEKPGKIDRDVKIAFDICKELGRSTGPLTKQVIGAMIDRHGVGRETIKKIWKEHCEMEKNHPLWFPKGGSISEG